VAKNFILICTLHRAVAERKSAACPLNLARAVSHSVGRTATGNRRYEYLEEEEEEEGEEEEDSNAKAAR